MSQYVGFDVDLKNKTFRPLFLDDAEYTVAPKKSNDLFPLTRSQQFVKDFMQKVEEGYTLCMNNISETAENTRRLLGTCLVTRVGDLAMHHAYSNPTSEDCKLFYRGMSLQDEPDLEAFAQAYDTLSGYKFKPELLEQFKAK